ncbi:MAG TPA: phosphatase PAP2 family protein [Chitinophagaceae bacterium]|nr:phosphatase PAP2 family protein [Chitinophagaceae bacterium]
MKKIIRITGLWLLLATLLVAACSKVVRGRTQDIAPLSPGSTDIEAGNWKPVLLTGPEQFPVAAPVATNSPDYIAQLSEIKSWQTHISQADQDNIRYWSAGAVLRWNEILRMLVAKHNLAPYQNPDGTYPVPSAGNPLAYPQFPFANPPYAARAYAYASAAQYDALVAAWHYKKLYGRPAPYQVDSSVQALVPRTDLPSYPSEDAVVEGAAVEILKLMFPGDQDYIQQQASLQRQARIQSGANVRSDIEAGEALGRQVAQLFVARARTDRAGAAGGNPAEWSQLEQDATARGEIPWYSLETPRRPPMLPLFGRVKPFLFDSATVIALRPPPPNATSSDAMKKEVAEELGFSKDDSRDHYRIVHVWADGVGTSTPPGHWDAIAAEDFIKMNLSEVRWARNMALLNMALMDAAIVCWDIKYYYFNPRPTQMNPGIKTLTGIPNFPSYVSGHSTFSGAASTILAHLNPDRAADYQAMAQEASMSRMFAGIHYRSDCQMGLVVGANVGNYAVLRATSDGAE